MIVWATAERLSGQVGASFYIFDEDRFRSNLRLFKQAFEANYSPVEIGYSYKTNYTPYVCQVAHEEGYSAEVVSEMEYEMAKRLGVPGDRIIFNGPLKSAGALIEAATTGSTINVDNLGELDALVKLLSATTNAAPARVALRCNFEPTGGRWSRFGISVGTPEFGAAVALARSSGVTNLVGLHCHLPARDLKSFERRAELMTALARSTFEDEPPESINLGGGFMGSMSDELSERLKLSPVEYNEYGAAIGARMRDAFGGTKKPLLVIEPGTAVVADTFTFVARVTAVKRAFGRNIANVAGSLFDISPTSRRPVVPATVISRNARAAAPREWTVGGFTCIEDDVLAEGLLATIDEGDYIAFTNVGSYSVTMRPPFISPRAAIIALSESSRPGHTRLVKRAEGLEDVLASFGVGEWT